MYSPFYNIIICNDADNIETYIKDRVNKDELLNNYDSSSTEAYPVGPSVNFAAVQGKENSLEGLIAVGADYTLQDGLGRNVLLCASEKGNLLVVQKLLNLIDTKKLMVMWSMRDRRGFSPLHFVVKYQAVWNTVRGHLGSLPNISDIINIRSTQNGFTPLMVASCEGLVSPVNNILELGAAVNLVDTNKCSSLIHAAKEGHDKVVNILISFHADLNLRDKNGDTALHWAFALDHVECINALLGAGASADLKNNKGEYAIPPLPTLPKGNVISPSLPHSIPTTSKEESKEKIKEEEKKEIVEEKIIVEIKEKEKEKKVMSKVDIQIQEGMERLTSLESECIQVLNFKPENDLLSLSKEKCKEINDEKIPLHSKLVYRNTQLKDLVEDFENFGGYICFAPSKEEMEKNSESFTVLIEKDDIVYPVCHEGLNRSQVMHLVLEGVMTKLGNKRDAVMGPHGAEGGYDPYQGYKDLNEDNFFEYCHGVMKMNIDEDEGEWLHRCYRNTFGRVKADRIGTSFGKTLELNPLTFDSDQWRRLEKERTKMREYFNESFYSHPDPSKRLVYICFMRAAPILMSRLCEVYKSKGLIMKNVYIIALPYGDDISSAGSKADIEAAKASGKMDVTRNSLSIEKHVETYKFYSSFMIGYKPSVSK